MINVSVAMVNVSITMVNGVIETINSITFYYSQFSDGYNFILWSLFELSNLRRINSL